MRSYHLILLLAILSAACAKRGTLISGDEPPLTYFDSLVNAQISSLVESGAELSKEAVLGNKRDVAKFKPDSAGWSRELDVFRQLGQFERAIHKGSYERKDGIRDKNSNLTLRNYRAIGKVPVTEVTFYYYREFTNVKKIEAVYQQNNLLYSTTRRLSLEFEPSEDKPGLAAYGIEGIQKMVFGDTVSFQVHSRINGH